MHRKDYATLQFGFIISVFYIDLRGGEQDGNTHKAKASIPIIVDKQQNMPKCTEKGTQ
jgi:hypothetical protein